MEYKHEIENSIHVFLSSSMKNEIFLKQRKAVISFFERMPLYQLEAIEISANPEDIDDRYIWLAKKWSNLVILILQEDLRKGVTKEFDAAKSEDKRIFPYVHQGEKGEELRNFILEVQDEATTKEFSDLKDLLDQIEKDLLKDLVEKYVRLYNENLELKEQLDRISTESQRKF